MKGMPAWVPKSWHLTTFGWSTALAAWASCRRRPCTWSWSWSFRCKIFSATRLSSTVSWVRTIV